MRVIEGDCLDVLPTLATASVDAVICDPPYPGIKRSYGYWTEAEWFALMNPVVEQCRRILKPTGSAVFVLQPNSERVGRMRTWLWEFMVKIGKEWGIVQDAWWWNCTMAPTVHCHRARGLMRPSVKACVWAGPESCWRDQGSVLWTESEGNAAQNRAERFLRKPASSLTMRKGRCAAVADERGGVTPFNLLPVPNADSQTSAGTYGHGAGTPLALLRWWTRYICPPGGLVLDPFAGSGTTGLAALAEGRDAVLIERIPEYVAIIHQRLDAERAKSPLFPDASTDAGVRQEESP